MHTFRQVLKNKQQILNILNNTLSGPTAKQNIFSNSEPQFPFKQTKQSN